jgi:hypothetical protein
MALNELVNEERPLAKPDPLLDDSPPGDWGIEAWAGSYGGGSISPGRGPLLLEAKELFCAPEMKRMSLVCDAFWQALLK